MNEKTILLSKLLKYYKRKEILQAILSSAEGKEISFNYNNDFFGKRPNMIQSESEVLSFVREGVTSFHMSEETWANPMALETGMRKKELDDLRVGWDLILDIDCKFWEYSKLTADLLVKTLKNHGIKTIGVKFSGNKGFHIGVPFESFPDSVGGIETRMWFPDGAKAIALYLEEEIKEELSKKILQKETITQISERTNKTFNELVTGGKFNPFEVIDIDTVLISSRHLFRMPYSYHEKSGLVSLVINPKKIMDFDRDDAKLDKIKEINDVFLDRENAKTGEANDLFVQAFDFYMRKDRKQIEKRIKEKYSDKKTKIIRSNELDSISDEKIATIESFPPCIQNGLSGLQDGKRRFLFALLNFLDTLGWDYPDIEKLVYDWNTKNPEPLRETYIKTQLSYYKKKRKGDKPVPPPNCDNKDYYLAFGICKPDQLCSRVKNPVMYAKRKQKMLDEQQERQTKEDKKQEREAKKIEKEQRKEQKEAKKREEIKEKEQK